MTTTDQAWVERFWTDGPAPGAGSPVAFGGHLSPALLLAAYRNGLFPIPCERSDAVINALLYADQVGPDGIRVVGGGPPDFGVAWWSPDPRPLLSVDSVRLGSGLAKSLAARRRWHTTVNHDFDRVLTACRAGRVPCWLTGELMEIMTTLHRLGWYHSVEVWSGDDLVGGAVGLGIGGVFSADSMFHHAGGASQIALVDLAFRLNDAGVRVLDLQWDSPHARRLGARLVDRAEFLPLAAASDDRIQVPVEPRPVDEMLSRLRARAAPVAPTR